MSAALALGLFLCNLVWAGNPTASKILLANFNPWQAAWIRYTFAGMSLLALAPLLTWRGAPVIARPKSKRDALQLVFLGILPFCAAPLTTLTGLAHSQASEGALIVAMEPLAVVVLAAVVLGESIPRALQGALAIALVGFVLLSGASLGSLTDLSHLQANLWILTAQVFEAAYSILGKGVANRYPATAIYGMAWLFGWVALSTVVGLHGDIPGVFRSELWDLPRLGAALWLGAIGSTGGYVFWMLALARVPVSVLAMSLFVQPVGGALIGVALLGDQLSPTQAVGGLFILAALLIQVRQSRL